MSFILPTSIIIRMPNWVGDAVMAMPALSLLKRSFPQCKISLLCRGKISEIFTDSPLCEEIIAFTSGKFVETIRILRREQYEAGILLTNSFSSALLFFSAGIPQRAGYSADGRRLLLTKPVKAGKTFRFGHQADSYIELIKEILADYKLPDNDVIRDEELWIVSEEEKRDASELLRQEGIMENAPLIGINPGAASGPAKRWPPDCFGVISDYCRKRYKAEIIIFGADADRNIANKIKEAVKNSPPVDLCGKTNLRQLGALIHRCSLFITNDTGPMHIASVLRVPIVAIFGSTKPEKTRPLSDNYVIVQKVSLRSPYTKANCMRQITPDDVIKAVEELAPSAQAFGL